MARGGQPVQGKSSWDFGGVASYVGGFLLIFVCSGPVLFITIQQVCVSRCLLLRRLPALAADLEDLLLVVLFAFYVLVNYLICRLLWSLLCKGLVLACNSLCGCKPLNNPVTLLDPKTTRSGRAYGYRKARYVRSDTSNESAFCG